MNQQSSLLYDARYEEVETGRWRRIYLSRQAIESQLHAFFSEKEVKLPPSAFSHLGDRTLFHAWRRCIRGLGFSTPYGTLPIEFVNVLKRAGYDPVGETSLPPWLFKSWELVVR